MGQSLSSVPSASRLLPRPHSVSPSSVSFQHGLIEAWTHNPPLELPFSPAWLCEHICRKERHSPPTPRVLLPTPFFLKQIGIPVH